MFTLLVYIYMPNNAYNKSFSIVYYHSKLTQCKNMYTMAKYTDMQVK